MSKTLIGCLGAAALLLAACSHGRAGSRTDDAVAAREPSARPATPPAVQPAPPARAALVPFQSPGGFSVLMPPGVQKTDQTQQTPSGQVNVHLAQSAAPSGAPSYLVSYTEFPEGVLEQIRTPDLLNGLQKAVVQQMHGTLVSSKDVEIQGLPGREFVAQAQGERLTGRALVGPQRVYTMVGRYQTEQAPADVARFLESFNQNGTTGIGGAGTVAPPATPAAPTPLAPLPAPSTPPPPPRR